MSVHLDMHLPSLDHCSRQPGLEMGSLDNIKGVQGHGKEKGTPTHSLSTHALLYHGVF